MAKKIAFIGRLPAKRKDLNKNWAIKRIEKPIVVDFPFHKKEYYFNKKIKNPTIFRNPMQRQVKTRISFWATRSYRKWKDKNIKSLYLKLLRLEDELAKIRNKLFEDYME